MRSPTKQEAGLSGIVGGFLWAITPLRQPIFDAGRTPDEGELFFRAYNFLLGVIVILLTVALFRLRETLRARRRLLTVGWWTILTGHALVLAGSLPAVLLGDEARSFVMGSQDMGFLGVLVTGVGALLMGFSGLRHREIPAAASWLLLLTLPLGLLAIVLLSAMGTPDDYLGLPITMLYGGAWVVLGWFWIRGGAESSTSTSALTPL